MFLSSCQDKFFTPEKYRQRCCQCSSPHMNMHPDNAQSRTVEVSPIAKLLMRYFQRTEVGAIGLSISFSFPTGQVIHAGLHDKLLRDIPSPSKGGNKDWLYSASWIYCWELHHTIDRCRMRLKSKSNAINTGS